MTIVESYSLGVPVIGAKIGGIPEIIIDGITGYLFDSHNNEQLYDVVSKANDLTGLGYNTFCANASDFSAIRFSKDIFYKNLISLYESVINNYMH